MKMKASAKKKMPRCSFAGCSRRAALVVGDCTFCKGEHCIHHRLPEEHSCANYGEAKTAARKRLVEEFEREPKRAKDMSVGGGGVA